MVLSPVILRKQTDSITSNYGGWGVGGTYPLEFLLLKEFREKDGWVTSVINQDQQKQHKVRALQSWRPGPFCKAQEPRWSDSMCQHHGKGSVLQWSALISKASGDVLMGSV